jgi:tetratricopeptide (TPR) repeat protein
MYKARTNQSGISSALIRGNFEVLGFPHMRKAEISVYNISTDELVGVYNTNTKTGNYLVILMPNLKYEFVINSYGYAPIKKIVEIPSYASTNISDELSKQQLTLSIDSGKVNLSVNTWFVEEKEPTLFLLTVYDETNEMNHKVELYETNEVEEIEVERRQLTETDFGNIDEVLKKQAEQENKKPELAEKAFLRKDYKTASEIYSQLLSLDASDTLANYRKGVSLYFLEHNKLKALPYLQKAEGSPKIPYDIYYYLGMIYHSWTDFAKAETALNEFKTKAKPTEVDALNINRVNTKLHQRQGIDSRPVRHVYFEQNTQ